MTVKSTADINYAVRQVREAVSQYKRFKSLETATAVYFSGCGLYGTILTQLITAPALLSVRQIDRSIAALDAGVNAFKKVGPPKSEPKTSQTYLRVARLYPNTMVARVIDLESLKKKGSVEFFKHLSRQFLSAQRD